MRVPSQTLRQTVTVEDQLENTGDGSTWGPERPMRCRVDWSKQLVRGSQGDDIYVTGTLIIRPESQIDVGARITIDGDKRIVFSVTPIYGPGAYVAARRVAAQ